RFVFVGDVPEVKTWIEVVVLQSELGLFVRWCEFDRALLHHCVVEQHRTRRLAVDLPITDEGWILINPATHFRKPHFRGGMRVETKHTILHRDAQTHRAGRQSHCLSKRDINLGEIPAKDWLSTFHLVVRFAWLARSQTRHTDAITALGQPLADLVCALPRRIGKGDFATELATQVRGILGSQIVAWLDPSLNFRHTSDRVAVTLNGE